MSKIILSFIVACQLLFFYGCDEASRQAFERGFNQQYYQQQYYQQLEQHQQSYRGQQNNQGCYAAAAEAAINSGGGDYAGMCDSYDGTGSTSQSRMHELLNPQEYDGITR
jgi:hypothetical protein